MSQHQAAPLADTVPTATDAADSADSADSADNTNKGFVSGCSVVDFQSVD